MYSKALREDSVVLTGSPIGTTIGVMRLTRTKRKINRRSSTRRKSKKRFTGSPSRLSASQAEIAALDPEDHPDRHRGGAECGADDDPRLRRPVRDVHDPLRQVAEGLARRRGRGLERREGNREEFEERNAP